MALNDSWNIRTRSKSCHATGEDFEDGDTVFAALFPNEEGEGYERRDFSAGAWEARAVDDPAPYSFWRSTFEVVEDPNKRPEVVEKESAEALLRRLIEEDEASSENARYILALMLERKKILKQVDSKESSDSRLLIYEHVNSGEAFIVRDPLLNLAEIDSLQEEVATWLGGGKDQAEPETAAEGESEVETGAEGESESEEEAADKSEAPA